MRGQAHARHRIVDNSRTGYNETKDFCQKASIFAEKQLLFANEK